MFGEWVYHNIPFESAPDAVKTAFSKAITGMVGVKYDPLLYVASQLVSGNNYCIICKTTLVVEQPVQGCKAVYIYADLKGNATITKIDDVIK